MKRLSNKIKIFITIFAALFVVVFSFLLINIITGRITLGEADAWDGETIATSFSSGNGTEENPYVISSPEEFMLFKNSVEGLDYEAYQDKTLIQIPDDDWDKFLEVILSEFNITVGDIYDIEEN